MSGVRRYRWPLVVLLMVVAGSWQLGQGAWIQAKALLAQWLLSDAWSRTLEDGRNHRPWSWADTWPVARLRVAALGVDQIVLAGVSGRTLAFGPGHQPGTAVPGADGNTVLAGHRDTHFRFLRDLRSGQWLRLDTPDGGSRNYRVDWLGVVDAGDLWVLEPGETTGLTLVTCYPFDSPLPGTRRRYVVKAYLDY